ncbi:MAG: putative bifunctional diguanylate cyclase/phosphodiesterase [Burkholderiales bacterium]
MTTAALDTAAICARTDIGSDRQDDRYVVSFRRKFRAITLGLLAINVTIGAFARYQQHAMIDYAMNVYDTAFVSNNYVSLAQMSFQRYADEHNRAPGPLQASSSNRFLEEVRDNIDIAIETSESPEALEIKASVSRLLDLAVDSPELEDRITDIQTKMKRLHERNSFAGLAARDAVEELSLKSDLLLLLSISTSILLGGLVLLSMHRMIDSWNRRSSDHLHAALEGMPQGLSMFDDRLRLIAYNSKYAEMYGLSADLLRPGTPLREILEHRVKNGTAPVDAAGDVEEAFASENGTIAIEQHLRNGRIISLLNAPLSTGGSVTIHMDVTEKRNSEKQIAFMAYHDGLTGLANRVQLREHIERTLEFVKSGGWASVLCLDLDGFKIVNDTLGHSIGDELLCAVAGRLRNLVGDGDLVARTGGDEFAIVQSGAEMPTEAAAKLAARIVEVLSVPFRIGDQTIVIGASVGIAVAPGDGDDVDQILKNADLALYRAKEDGRAGFHFFESEMDIKAQARRMLELDLRRAVLEGEFELFYQPIVNLAEDRVSGFEALLRWNHPTRGKVPPDEFIPVAEQTGLIVAIGEWVIKQACVEASTWPSDLRVSVNVSPVQFRCNALVSSVVSALAASGLRSDRLELEITESVLMQNNDATLAILHQLRGLGVKISMDDFGTGYSSLSYLRSFPFDKIKIDQSFVRDLVKRPDSIAIIRAVAALGESFGMATTVEGVETEDQLQKMRAEGCTEVQGYFFSKPLPANEIDQLLSGFQKRGQVAA